MHVVLPARSLALPKPSPPVPSRWLVLVVALAGLGKVAALFNLS